MKPPCDSCINSRDNFFAFAASNTPGSVMRVGSDTFDDPIFQKGLKN